MILTLKIIALVSSIFIIASVLLQESKSDGLSGVIGGGAEQLFGKRKSKGYDKILHRITLISSVIFFAACIVGNVL